MRDLLMMLVSLAAKVGFALLAIAWLMICVGLIGAYFIGWSSVGAFKNAAVVGIPGLLIAAVAFALAKIIDPEDGIEQLIS